MIVVNMIANGPMKRKMFAKRNATKNIADANRANASIKATTVVATPMSRIENCIGSSKVERFGSPRR